MGHVSSNIYYFIRESAKFNLDGFNSVSLAGWLIHIGFMFPLSASYFNKSLLVDCFNVVPVMFCLYMNLFIVFVY